MSRRSLVQASDSTSRRGVGRRRLTPAERTGRSLRKRRPFLPWHPVWHRATEAPRMVLPLHRGTRRSPRPPHRRTDPSPGRWRAAPPRAVPPSSTRSSTAPDMAPPRRFQRTNLRPYRYRTIPRHHTVRRRHNRARAEPTRTDPPPRPSSSPVVGVAGEPRRWRRKPRFHGRFVPCCRRVGMQCGRCRRGRRRFVRRGSWRWSVRGRGCLLRRSCRRRCIGWVNRRRTLPTSSSRLNKRSPPAFVSRYLYNNYNNILNTSNNYFLDNI